ncbi:MAG TPA: TlpA disulfide reductase family protein [Puia sp.]|nr:TlpA disulfide reductase family protein [Puia sp.]
MKTLLVAFCFLTWTGHLPAQGIRKVKIDELKSYIEKSDHPLIVNFWATYCVPCAHEIPYFQTEAKKYKTEGVELILVSLDLPDFYPAKISAFVKKENYTSAVLWLDESNADYFCPKIDQRWTGGIPSTLFVNNKHAYHKFFERQLTEPQVEDNIKALVK